MKTHDEVIAMIEYHMSHYCAADYDEPCLFYLKEYQKLLQKSRSERLCDILREVRGEK